MANDSNAALLSTDRLTATGIPSSPFEDPSLLGITPRASSLASAITPGLSALAATPADIDIEAIGANWVAQGPAPINNPIRNGGTVTINPNNQVSGAIRTVIVNPNDPNTLWVGTVNGGIWRTSTANQAAPAWTPLTDEFRGLSIGAMDLDPTNLDPQGNPRSIVAGTGHFSSYGFLGGPLTGLLLSTDGGNTFREVRDSSGNPLLQNRNISSVVIRGNTILAATDSGVFRLDSNDNGATWSSVGTNGIPAGGAFDLVADSANNFYVAIQGVGIFLSDINNGGNGANWVNVSAPDPTPGANNVANGRNAINTAIIPGADINRNTKMTVAANGRIYVGVVRGTDGRNSRPFYIGFSDNRGATWIQMNLPTPLQPGGQGERHFSILADPNNPNIVYLGGDSGPLFRGTTSVSGNTTTTVWQNLSGNGGAASNSSPHADSRDMILTRAPVVDVNGNPVNDPSGNPILEDVLIEVDDGGIYRRTNPRNLPNLPADPHNTGGWFSLNGNLQITEQYSIAYDPYSGIIISGNQDNGTAQQNRDNQSQLLPYWTNIFDGDGGDVAVTPDPTNAARTVRYFSSQYLNTLSREIYDSSNTAQMGSRTTIPFTIIGSGGKTLFSEGFGSTSQGISPFKLNAVDPRRMLIGTKFLYESSDQGDNLTSLGGLNNLNSDGVDNDKDGKPDEGDEFTPAGEIGTVNAIAYGGRLNGTPNADIAYVSSTTGLRLRTARTAGNLSDFTQLTAYPSNSTPLDIVLDPNDWMKAFVVDTNNQVFQTSNAGTAWTNITGDLFSTLNLQSGDYLRSIEFVDSPTLNALAVGTSQGVFASLSTNWSDWFQVGPATLPNAPVWDMDYNRNDPLPTDTIQTANILVAGTLGRGAWLLSNITNILNSAPRPNGGTAYTVNEGSAVMLSASGSSDPNGLVLTYTWDLDGDGIFGETGNDAKLGNEVGINPTFSAAELNGFEGSQKVVKLRVTNSAGSSAVDKNIRINIKNVAPTINGLALSSTVINENDTINLTGSFSDPGILDKHKVTINWGDGTSSKLGESQIVQQPDKVTRTFQLSHQYLDDPPSGTASDLLPITVTVDDFDGGIAQASTVTRVNNIAPVITSFTSNANFADRARINKPVNINATFTDIGTLDTHRAFVDWGDGTPTQEVTVLQSSGAGAVQGSHVYAKGGAYTMKLTLNDDDTGTDARSTRAIVIGNSGGPG